MSDFDDVVQPENEAQKPATKAGHAERKRPVLKGDPVEKMHQLGFEQMQHPGRFEGGEETVLRPAARVSGPSDTDMAERYSREEQRAEFLLAAQAARTARKLLATYAQTPRRERAIEEGHKGISRAYVHLSVAMHLGDLRHAPKGAVADAYANCVSLLMELDHLEPGAATHNDLSKLIGQLLRETGMRIPATPEARQRVADKHAGAEASARSTVFTAPLRNASLVLSVCVDDFLLTVTSPDRTDRTPSDEKGPKFSAAAKKAAALVGRAMDSCHRTELGIDPHDSNISSATRDYLSRAQRFLNWATSETLPGDVLTHNAVALIKDASGPLIAWCAADPLVERRPAAGDNRKQEGNANEDLLTNWNRVFSAQSLALQQLANATDETYPTPWSDKIFASIVKVGLATLVGGPAGAAGAIAGTFINTSDKPTRSEEGKKGGFANAIESLVGAAINEAVDHATSSIPEADARRRFFNAQALALEDAKARLSGTVLRAAEEEAERSPQPAKALGALTTRLRAGAERIATLQQRRAVQDWFTYCARASHGLDKKSGGTDMTGVGDTSRERFLLGSRAPDGVLELEIKLDGAVPRIAGARVGSVRKDDVDHLKGVRIRDLQMPIQFRILTPTDDVVPAVAVVSRNEVGVLWLSAADRVAREKLVARSGGRASSDVDVLRAATILVHGIGEHMLTNVGGAE